MNEQILAKIINDTELAKKYITEGISGYLDKMKEGLELLKDEEASMTIFLYFLTLYYGDNEKILKIPKQYYDLYSDTPFRLEMRMEDDWLIIQSFQEE